MLSVDLTPQFRRQFKKLPRELQYEAFEKIELFKNPTNHQTLHVHKLKGKLAGFWSFSVNYRYRIVFGWLKKDKKSAALLAVGDHEVYR